MPKSKQVRKRTWESYTEKNFPNCQGRRPGGVSWEESAGRVPCILESVETDVSAFVDVTMVNLCLESDFRWAEWVRDGELDIESKHSSVVPEL